MDKKELNETIDLRELDLEPHVEEAFRIAWSLAGGQPIGPGDALLGALAQAAGEKSSSDAFEWLLNHFPNFDPDAYRVEKELPADDSLLHLTQQLATSYTVAKQFLGSDSIWGRDYITVVLLSEPDPPLMQLIKEQGLSLTSLKDEWFVFVTTQEDSNHRRWREWWQSAGISPPEQTPETKKKAKYSKINKITEEVRHIDLADPEEVKKYQQSKGLIADGIVGPQTRAAMLEDEARQNTGRLSEIIEELIKPHGYHDSIIWQMTPEGISIEGDPITGSKEEPQLVAQIWEKFGSVIDDLAGRLNVPAELIVATVLNESHGNPEAVHEEPKYDSDERTPDLISVGLMQTTVAAARAAMGADSIDRAWLLEPANSILAGTAAIANQFEQTRFDPPKVACAYIMGGIFHDDNPDNRWKMRQPPIGSGQYIDRFIERFNDCFRYFDQENIEPQTSFYHQLAQQRGGNKSEQSSTSPSVSKINDIKEQIETEGQTDVLKEPWLVLSGHRMGLSSAAFSPDGEKIVTGSDDSTALIWDIWTGSQLQTLARPPTARAELEDSAVHSVTFSPDGKRVVTASEDHTARIWDVDNGDQLAVLRGHEGPVFSASFSPDGTRVATISSDQTVRIWDSAAGDPLTSPILNLPEAVISVSFSPDGRRLLTFDEGGIRLWDASTGELINAFEGEVTAGGFSPEGDQILSAMKDGQILLFDTETLQSGSLPGSHSGSVRTIAFSNAGPYIAIGSRDEAVRIWDRTYASDVAVIHPDCGQINGLAFSPDGSFLVTAGTSDTAKVWDLSENLLVSTERLPKAPSYSDGAEHVLKVAMMLTVSAQSHEVNGSHHRLVLGEDALILALANGGWGDLPADANQGLILAELLRSGPDQGAAYREWSDRTSGELRAPPESQVPDDVPGDEIIGLEFFVWRVLERAESIRTETGAEDIGVRHLLAGLVLENWNRRNLARRDRLGRFGVDERGTRRGLFNAFSPVVSTIEVPQWRQILLGEAVVGPTGFSGESVSGEDRLDVKRYATALASVIASTDVEPPLSVGVFGDWGSGKSFFMNLITEELRELGKDDRLKADGTRQFCGYIVPVQFNAWHYAETDLWASLVQNIFAQLDAYFRNKPEDVNEIAEPQELLKQFDLAVSNRKEAEAQLKKAKKEETTAAKNLSKAEDEVNKKNDEMVTISSKDVYEIARNKVLQNEKQLKELAIKAENQLGLTGLTDKLEEGKTTINAGLEVVNDARILALRSKDTINWLLHLPIARKVWFYLAGVALGIIALGAGFIWFLKSKQIEGAAVISLVTQLIVFMGVVVTAARSRLKRISGVFDEVDRVRLEVDETLAKKLTQAEQERDVKLAAARDGLDTARAKVNKARDGLREAEQKVEEAKERLADSTSARRIAKLIRERMDTGDYEKRLGIIAMIRQDLERLGNLLRARRKELEGQIPRLPEEIPADKKPLDRIVLFIDDIDRCPSEQVVRVLEAVHLLLAVPLFVVVMGVDVRWIVRSLRARFPHHLAELSKTFTGGSPAEAPDIDSKGQTNDEMKENGNDNSIIDDYSALSDRATALDYVEKIFQIPFWLPPMDVAGSRNLISSLVTPSAATAQEQSEDFGVDNKEGELEEFEGETETTTATGEQDAKETTAVTNDGMSNGKEQIPEPAVEVEGEVDQQHEPEETPGGELEGAPVEDVKPDSGKSDTVIKETLASMEAQETDDEAVSEKSASGKTESLEGADTGPQAAPRQDLEIFPAERAFMLELGSAVGRSPRRLKRFVNAYRVLKAANTPLDKKVFIIDDGRSGVYHAVLTLLAVTTGAPSLANLVLNRLVRANETQDFEEFLDEIRDLVVDPVWNEELHCMEAAFDCYKRARAKETEPLSVEELHKWAADVARFTFRAGGL
jgi:WD40 repeat protein